MYLEVADNRHPSIKAISRYFDFDHLNEPMRGISESCADLAQEMIDTIHDDPELTVGLRKLLEAKDCFVRAVLPVDEEVPTSAGVRQN